MNTFDRDAFLIDALTRERERITQEIDAMIEDVKAGRAFPNQTSSANPAGHGEEDEVDVDGAEEEAAAPNMGDDDALADDADDEENPLIGRHREAFENRRDLALETVKAKGGEAPISDIFDAFEVYGLDKRLVRSALESLRRDKKVYLIKRTNPSDNTWALWDHPSAAHDRGETVRDGGVSELSFSN